MIDINSCYRRDINSCYRKDINVFEGMEIEPNFSKLIILEKNVYMTIIQ